MLKFSRILKNDNVLRHNIAYAGALTFLFYDVGIIVGILRMLFTKGNLEIMHFWFLSLLGLNAVFITLLLFMYVIKENLFRPQIALLISFLISICIVGYFGLNSKDLAVTQLVAGAISTTIYIFYPILGLGLMVRQIWESMQERVGGEYRAINLKMDDIFSSKNLGVFSISIILYLISWRIANGYGISFKSIIISFLMGSVTFAMGFILNFFINLLLSFRKIQ